MGNKISKPTRRNFLEALFEIWTRLVIELDEGWLEVFNALDENDYAYHEDRPAGVFIPCLPAS